MFNISTHYIKLPLIFIAVLVIFFNGLFNYFFQDDFINIYLGWITDISDLERLLFSFKSYPEIAYRPLTFIFFGSSIVHLFSMQPFLFHLSIYLLHFAVLFILFRVLKNFFLDKKSRYACITLYALCSIHFGPLYWMTASYVLLGTFFLLLAYTYIYRNKNLAIVFFIFAILTNEGLFAFPVYIAIEKFLVKKKSVSLLPFFLIALISLVFRKSISGFQTVADYRIGSLPEIIATFKWYFLRALNIPEAIRSFPENLKNLIYLLLIISLAISLLAVLYTIRKKIGFSKNIFLGIIWFILFGFIFFLLPGHLSGYYLHTALIGFCIAWISLLNPLIKSKSILKQAMIYMFLFSWFLLSFVSVKYLEKTSWIVWRANIAKKYISKAKKLYPVLPPGATIVFMPRNVSIGELSNTLYKGKALQLFYKDPNLKVFFADESYKLSATDYLITD